MSETHKIGGLSKLNLAGGQGKPNPGRGIMPNRPDDREVQAQAAHLDGLIKRTKQGIDVAAQVTAKLAAARDAFGESSDALKETDLHHLALSYWAMAEYLDAQIVEKNLFLLDLRAQLKNLEAADLELRQMKLQWGIA